MDHLCSDGISDKSNHPQLNNQNNVTIALQIKCAIGRRRRRRRRRIKRKRRRRRDVDYFL